MTTATRGSTRVAAAGAGACGERPGYPTKAGYHKKYLIEQG